MAYRVMVNGKDLWLGRSVTPGQGTSYAYLSDAERGAKRYLERHPEAVCQVVLYQSGSLVKEVRNTLLHSLLKHVSPEPLTGCWLWAGGLNRNGYGAVKLRGSTRVVHRLLWQAYGHPLTDDQVLDHLCRVRSCCNPRHLEAVTPAENTRRGEAVLFARK